MTRLTYQLCVGLALCCSLSACLVPSGKDPIQHTNTRSSSLMASSSSSSSQAVFSDNQWVVEEGTAGFCRVTGSIENLFSQSGFQGLGYVNTLNRLDSRISYSIHVPAPGVYGIRVRFWNNTTLALGGRITAEHLGTNTSTHAEFTGGPTGATWQYEDLTLALESGTHRFTFTPAQALGLPSIDSIALDSHLEAAPCPDEPSSSRASSSTMNASSTSSTSANTIVWQSPTQVQVAENTTAIFYFAQAQSLSANPIFYELAGADADAFRLQNTGELRFTENPDYENPADTQRSNRYQVTVIAKDGTHTSQLDLSVEVTNLFKPTLQLVSPKSRANIGEGVTKSVAISLRFYDEETGITLGNGVQANGVAFNLDTTDQLWKGQLDIPANTEAGPTPLTLMGSVDGQSLTQTDYLNNKWALKPIALTLPSLDYLYFFDAVLFQVAKLDLATGAILPVFNLSGGELGVGFQTVDGLPRTYLDANPDNSYVYTALKTTGNKSLLGFATLTPLNGYKYGLVPNPISLVYDGKNQQVILITEEDSGYQVYGVPINSPFINLRLPAAQAPNKDAPLKLLWTPSTSQIRGRIKQATVYKGANALIVADERQEQGLTYTHIQAFQLDTQETLFTTKVGPDISPFAVDENRKLLYFADSNHSKSLTLKALNLATGDTLAIASSQLGTGPMPSSISAITYERFSKTVYLADANSDTFYALNTTTLARKELKAIRPLPSGN